MSELEQTIEELERKCSLNLKKDKLAKSDPQMKGAAPSRRSKET